MDKLVELGAKWLRGVAPASSHSDSVKFVLRLAQLEIGRLWTEDGKWIFEYSDAFRNQTQFKPIVGFPDVNKSYENSALWPFFTIRIPSLTQPVVQEYLRGEGLDEPDEATLLKEFGRRSIANPFELVAV